MMTDKESMWSRVGQWVGAFRRDDTLPQLALHNGLPPVMPPEPPADNGDSLDATSSNRRMPWRKRDQILEQLQSGYGKVLDLVSSIQDHLTLHNQRSDQVADLLMVLSKGIEDVPKATREHAASLENLTRQMKMDSRKHGELLGAISELPRGAEAQRQGMAAIAAQVQVSAEATDKLSNRLNSVGQVVQMLGEALEEQVQTLKLVQQSTRHQDRQLISVLDQQSRRANLLTAAVLALAGIMAIATGINLFT